MRRNAIGFIIIMATVSVVGLLLIQFFFLKNSYDLNEKQFHQLTSSALRSVASRLNDYNDKLLNHPSKTTEGYQVERISNNYYVVNVNDVIDASLLEHFLKDEFRKRSLNLTFEYAIYDCNTQKMIHGNIINSDSLSTPVKHTNPSDVKKKVCTLPTCEKYTY